MIGAEPFGFQVEIPTPATYAPRAMPPLQVLVVDDDDDIRDYLGLALRALGHTVTVVTAADRVPPDLRPDVALVDLLVEGDATAALALVRWLVGHGARVVLITGLSLDAPPVQVALASGAGSVLQKPFTLDAVRAAVAPPAQAP